MHETTLIGRPLTKSAFVTGAANGIGRSITEHLVKDGWFVGIADVDERGLNRLVSEWHIGRVQPFLLDVTDTSSWQASLARFHKLAGRLDLLVNNAGVIESGNFESGDIERYHRLVDINVKGALNGCHAAFPYLSKTPGACVINLSSTSATYGQAQLATYSASKFALRGLTEALNIEWEHIGIRVVDIMPLFVQTGMVDGLSARSFERLGAKLTPDMVAHEVLNAANDAGDYGRVHRHVGWVASCLYTLTSIGPDRIVRWVAKKIAA